MARIKFKVVDHIVQGGFPTSSPHYQSAHRQADKAEKAAYPRGYQAMKHIDMGLPKGELAGKNTRSGKIEVSSRVPPRYRAEVALHEKVESKALAKYRK